MTPSNAMRQAQSARVNEYLDRRVYFGGQTVIRRDFLNRCIKEGYRVKVVDVTNHAKIKRINNELKALQNGWGVPHNEDPPQA